MRTKSVPTEKPAPERASFEGSALAEQAGTSDDGLRLHVAGVSHWSNDAHHQSKRNEELFHHLI